MGITESMLSHLDLGSAPPNEDCAQTGSPDYEKKAKDECRRYLALIRRKM